MTNRQIEALKTRKLIYETAMKLFEEYGFDNVKIMQICNAANVSTGAFYHHFEKKEEILVEQYRVVDRTFWTNLDDLSADTYLGKVVEYMGKYSLSAEKDGVRTVNEVYRVWLTLRQGFPFIEGEGATHGLKELLSSAQESGELDEDVDIEELIWDILIIVRGTIYYWCQKEGNFNLTQKTERIVSQFLYSYGFTGNE